MTVGHQRRPPVDVTGIDAVDECGDRGGRVAGHFAGTLEAGGPALP